MKYVLHVLYLSTALALAVACGPAATQDGGTDDHAGHDDDADHDHDHDDDAGHTSPFDGIHHAICIVSPTEGNTTAGTIHFMECGGKVTITAHITGLAPGQKHAIHVHQFGDISGSDGKTTGGHYNPEGHDHGLPEQTERHAGDLGNLEADETGHASFEITVDNMSIAGHHAPIIGRAIIIHAGADDGGQPTGNAGARIGQGVIGIAKGEE